MNWNSAAEFWAMRGYGLYVWGSYAMTLGLMLFEALAVVRRRRVGVRASGADTLREHA